MENEQLTLLEALAYFKEKMDTVIEDGDAPAFKEAEFVGNKLKLYRTEDKSDDSPKEIDFPEEKFLDQAKTTFVDPFKWSIETYPGSEDPSLDGKPVLVLGVKGDTSTTYSFVNLEKLMPKAVEISEEEGNLLEDKGDGLFVGIPISEESDNLLESKEDGLFVGLDLAAAKVTTKDAIDALFSE